MLHRKDFVEENNYNLGVIGMQQQSIKRIKQILDESIGTKKYKEYSPR